MITHPSNSVTHFTLRPSLLRVRHFWRSRAWRPILAFTLPFVIYLLTLAPSIYNLDSAELTTASATGGLMRATGYPLYLTLGHFWSRLPLGDVGYRMNLFSAFWGALTILLSERILHRWQVGGWAAFGALGLLATAPYFWGLSLVAEVYTLHTALMAGLILALLRWSESPTAWRLGLVGLVMGLGMTHHAAMALLIPGAVLYLLLTHPRRLFQPRALLFGLVGLLLGLSFYLYLPLRYLAQPAFNYAGSYDAVLVFRPVDLSSLGGLWWLISGKAFNNVMLGYSGAQIWGELRSFLQQLSQSFFAVGLLPALYGFSLLFRRNWRDVAMTSLMFLFSAGFYINYRVIDKATMFLPTYLVWALWLGIGFQGLLDQAARVDDLKLRRTGTHLLQAGMVGLVLLALVWNWRMVDLSQDWSTRRLGESILQRVEPGALVFGWWDSVPAVQYLQLVEGQRPDVQAVNRFLISPQDLDQVILKEVSRRPVYIDHVPTSLLSIVTARPAGPVYRLEPANARHPTAYPVRPGRY